MAHYGQLKFVETAARLLRADWKGAKVLEIGSHDVNGSIRPFFAGSDYIGVDLSEGKGVDVVASGHVLDYPAGSFDLSASCECFEHNPQWRETFLNMCRMTRPGGAVIVTCATFGRGEHGTRRTTPLASPGSQDLGWDYYRNLGKADFEALGLGAYFKKWAFYSNSISKDLYFVGLRQGEGAGLDIDTEALGTELYHMNSLFKPLSAPWSTRLGEPLYRHIGGIAAWLPEPIFQFIHVHLTRLAVWAYERSRKR